jgi:hypothetical protein
MPGVTLELLQKVGTRWELDSPGIRYEDDPKDSAREKATRAGEQWVSEDPDNRDYNVFESP